MNPEYTALLSFIEWFHDPANIHISKSDYQLRNMLRLSMGVELSVQASPWHRGSVSHNGGNHYRTYEIAIDTETSRRLFNEMNINEWSLSAVGGDTKYYTDVPIHDIVTVIVKYGPILP